MNCQHQARADEKMNSEWPVMDDHPNQDLVEFHALVQKALTVNIERAEKQARLQRSKLTGSTKRQTSG
jgi:hypothetical protein